MKKHNIVKSFLSILLVLAISILSSRTYAVTQSQINALESEKLGLHKKRTEMELHINDLRSRKVDILEQKSALDDKNELARNEIEIINKQVKLYNEYVKIKAQELCEAEKNEVAQRAALEQRMRAMEENFSFSYISILFQAKNLTEFLSLFEDVRRIMEYDKQLEENYIAARKRVERSKSEYEETLDCLTKKQLELEKEKSNLEAQIAAAENLILELDRDIEAFTSALQENLKQEERIQKQIGELSAQLAKKEEDARKLAQQNNEIYNGIGSVATGSFLWPCPSSSYVTSKFGPRLHPVFKEQKPHTGIDVSANSDSAVIASDGGIVQIAQYNSSYGNYVVIYHTNGLTTLYAHMSSIAVKSGQTVLQGDIIGYVGSTGISTGPHLHFEISSGGTRVDPLGYFSGYTLAPGL